MWTLVRTKDYSCRNKLQKAVYELLKEENRQVFSNQVEVFKHYNKIAEAIAELCKKNPKCTPVRLGKQTDGDGWAKDLRIWVEDVMYLTYYFGNDSKA
jgi:hypothetical protein